MFEIRATISYFRHWSHTPLAYVLHVVADQAIFEGIRYIISIMCHAKYYDGSTKNREQENY